MRYERIWRTQSVIVPLLLLALLPLPYGCYIILRFFCCLVFAYLGIRALDDSKTIFAYVLFGVAVIYNPIFRLHLNREAWSIINIVTIAIALASVVLVRGEIIPAAKKEELSSSLNSTRTKQSHPIISPEQAWEKARMSYELNFGQDVNEREFIHSFCWLVVAGLPHFLLKSTKKDVGIYGEVLNTLYPKLYENRTDDNSMIFRLSGICAAFINEHGDYYPAYEKYCLHKEREVVPPFGASALQLLLKPRPGECTFQEYKLLQKHLTVTALFMRACTNAHKLLKKTDGNIKNMSLYFPYDEIEIYMKELDMNESIDVARDEFMYFVLQQTEVLRSKDNDLVFSDDPFNYILPETFKRMNK